MYIIFEGIDTSGKSTQIELIKQAHQEVLVTKEPYSSTFRDILLGGKLESKRAEILLFLADRAEHYHKIVKPNPDRLVLSDRGFISGMAYALANGNFDKEELLSFNKFALKGNMPDKIILFITDMPTLKSRISTMELDSIEERGLEYLLEVQEIMRDIITSLNIPHLFVDATDDIDSVNKTITDYIKRT
jgi:dTMP kinase